MTEFMRHGPPVAVAGGYWERYPAFRAYALGTKPPEIIRALTAAAKVNLCLVRRANRDGHVMRSFEIAATGGCMLAQDTDEHREIFGPEGEAVVYFRDAKEAAERARALLCNSSERKRLAAGFIVASSVVLTPTRIGLQRCLASRAADEGTRMLQTGPGDVMLNELLIWGALLVGLVFLVVDKRRGIGALTLAYFLALSLGHVPGLLAYLDPNMTAEATKVGFDVTLIGMTAFIVGAMAARILPRRTTSVKAYQQTFSADIFSRLGWRVLTIGIVAYFVVLPVSALVPSLTAITSSLGTLLILGFWLLLYSAAIANDSRRTLLIF